MSNLKEKIKFGLETATATVGAVPIVLAANQPMLCTSISSSKLATASDPFKMVDNAISLILTLISFVGWVLLAFGAWSLISATINDEPQSKTKAVPFLIMGIACIGAKLIFKMISGQTAVS